MDKQKLRQAHIDWSASEGFDVFATLKFRNGYDIGEQQAERILRIFLNKLDRTYFGKRQIRQGQRVKRFVYMHKGRSGQNTHYHVLFEAIGNLADFCALVRELWANSFCETDGAKTQATRLRSTIGSSAYALHEYSSLGESTFLDQLSHTTPNFGTGTDIRLVRRLLKALDGTR